MQTIDHGRHADIREAVRALCSDFPAEYHRKVRKLPVLLRTARRGLDLSPVA